MKLIRSLSMRSNSGLLVADGPTSRTTTPMSTKREKRPPMDLMSVSLEELARVVAEDADAPDVSHVMRYGQMLLESGLGSKQKQKNPRLIYHGSLLMDWAAQHGYPLSTGLQRMLGYAHSETWLSGGVHSEVSQPASLLCYMRCPRPVPDPARLTPSCDCFRRPTPSPAPRSSTRRCC